MKFKILEKTFHELQKWLFQSNDENLAFLVCNVVESENVDIILVEETIYPSKGITSRSPTHISYSPASYIGIMEKHESSKKVIIKVHNHHRKLLDFSPIDDISDIEFSDTVRKFINAKYVGSMIMGFDDTIKIRFYDKTNYMIYPNKTFVIGKELKVLSEQFKVNSKGFQDYAKDIFGDYNVALMRSLKVGIIGLGGTGSSVFELLCRSYIGEIALFDHDDIEEKNISRLHESTINDVGKSKAKHFSTRARLINRDIEVEYLDCKVNSIEGRKLLKTCDVVFGCMDKTSIGRVFVDLIKNGYLIPYIDLGLAIHTSEKEKLKGIYARISRMIPGESCTYCNRIVNSQSLSSELFKGTELDNEYLENFNSKHDPQLISYNSLVANLGFNNFLEYIMKFGENFDSTYKLDLISFDDVSVELECPCSLCKLDLGVGDSLDTTDYEVECNNKFKRLNKFSNIQYVKESDTFDTEHGTLIIERFKKRNIFAFFLCPCGCGETIRLGLTKDFSPKWGLKTRKGKVTISPSVYAFDLKCESHFYIIDSKIIWV